MRILAVVGLGFFASVLAAQTGQRHFTEGVDIRAERSQPVLHYTLTLREGDTTGFRVRIAVRNAPDTFRIAMAKHPEYDDRFFRFVMDERVSTGSIVRLDSMTWRVIAPGGATTIDYRVQLPPAEQPPRAAWRPFLTPTGGLTGGPHAFMYILGAELAPSHVTVSAPAAWTVTTGLSPTADPRTWFASNAYVLVESPILVGALRQWRFAVDGVPHTVAYWPSPAALTFDTAVFLNGIERLTREAVAMFGRPPYREYTFQFQDLAFGGLEHHNSVTLGAPSDALARDPHAVLAEAAHEFVHTWNLMRIRPAEYVGVSHRQIRPVPTLWFSEGLTMMYADVLLRRAGLPTSDSARATHVGGLMTRYLGQPGNSRFSAEAVSRVAYNAPPDALGDYDANSHLTGELLGTMLDLIVRDATDGRRSMDEVMRVLLHRSNNERGFGTADIERAIGDVCGCAVKPFFDAHIRGAGAIDFNRYLALAGLRSVVTARRAPGRDGQPAPDYRIWAWNPPGADSSLSLVINSPQSVWGRAGLHSGDRVVSMNGVAVRTWPDFRRALTSVAVGDTLTFVVRARGTTTARTVRVVQSGYDQQIVRIEPMPGATPKQLRLRDAWMRGAP